MTHAYINYPKQKIPTGRSTCGDIGKTDKAIRRPTSGHRRRTLDRLQPNGDYAKLVVLQKRTDDDVAYMVERCAGTSRSPAPFASDPTENIDSKFESGDFTSTDRFSFRLMNPGTGGDPSMEALER